jgi:DNA-binding IclR family transcriptional regulator
MKPGQRVPLVPPIGIVFLAWSEESEIEDYLGRLDPDTSPADLDVYRQALASIRERGYWVGYRVEATASLLELHEEGAEIHSEAAQKQLHEALAALAQQDYIRLSVEDSERAPVNHIAAPIFDSDGRVALALTVALGVDSFTGAEIREMAHSLLRATENVMDLTNGQRPNPRASTALAQLAL